MPVDWDSIGRGRRRPPAGGYTPPPRQSKTQARVAALDRLRECAVKYIAGRASIDQLTYSCRHCIDAGCPIADVAANAQLSARQVEGLLGQADQLTLPVEAA